MPSFPGIKTWTVGPVNSGDFNTYISNAISWLAGTGTNPKPSCYVTHGADQTVANNAWTALSMNTELWDVGDMHDTVNNTTKVIIPANCGGKYLLTGCVQWEGNATGYRAIGFRINNSSSYVGCRALINGGTTFGMTVSSTTMRHLNGGDYVELVVFQLSGGNLIAKTDQSYDTPTLGVIWMAS